MASSNTPIESSTSDPLPCRWAALSALNTELFQSLPPEVSVLRSQLRRTAVDLAGRWTQALAADWGLRTMEGDPSSEQSLVVTGHQPAVLHAGVAEKTARLSHFIRTTPGYTGINIVLDTDESDGMPILFPSGDPPQRMRMETSEAGVPYGCSSTLPRQQLARVREAVLAGLRSCNPPAAQQFAAYEGFFERGGESATAWGAALRRTYEGAPQYLDLPFSQLMQSESARSIMAWFVGNAAHLHRLYNKTLDDFRADHKIENPANPFPNLGEVDGSIEIPMWLLNSVGRSRHALMLRRNSTAAVLTDDAGVSYDVARLLGEDSTYTLVPRGALISLFLRVFLADSFIHGTGGARYDQYTDRLIQAFFQIEPPRFISVTATRLLFPAQAALIAWAEAGAAAARIAQFHPRRFIAEGFFRDSDVELVLQLAARREELVAEIRRCKDRGLSSRGPTRQAKLIDRALAEAVHSARQEKLKGIEGLSEEHRAAYLDREYPVMFLPPHDASRKE